MFVLAVLLLAAPQTQNATVTPSATPTPVAGKTVTVVADTTPPAEKVTCTREVPVGSMFAKKICRTAAQRAAAASDTQTALDRARSSNGSGLSRD